MAEQQAAGQIVALGGGGFSEEPDNLALDRYVLSLARRPTPRVCFVPTASGDDKGYIARFYTSFASLDCTPTHLSQFAPPTADLDSFVHEQDVVYVGGGSTRNLLVLWREWGLDRALTAAWHTGVVLAGISAGSLCWFEEGVTDSMASGELRGLRCLGLLPGSNCPHYDAEPGRRPLYQKLIGSGQMKPGYACDNDAGIYFEDNEVKRVVHTRPDAKVYYVSVVGGKVTERLMEPELIS